MHFKVLLIMRKSLRFYLLVFLYNHSQKLYVKLFKFRKKAWDIRQHELLLFPEATIGRELGLFYQKHQIQMMPKLENHDMFHLISETGIQPQDEIAMQFYLLGNGKISLYLLGVLVLGLIIYPEHLRYYQSHFKKGANARTYYHWQFEHLLWQNLNKTKEFINHQNKK